MEATLNQEAICTMPAERLKELTNSIEKAKSEDELAEIAEDIAVTGKAAKDSIERAFGDGSLSGCQAAMSLSALGDALEEVQFEMDARRPGGLIFAEHFHDEFRGLRHDLEAGEKQQDQDDCDRDQSVQHESLLT